jgi:uncharacterized protein (DUF2164 family)
MILFDMKIELSKEQTEIALSSIQRFFDEQMNTPIGNIESKALLKFVIEEIGPSIYNKAILDAQDRIQIRASELDIELYEEEFQYWRK